MTVKHKEETAEKTMPRLAADHVVIVTNRGPVEYYLTREHELKSRRGSGGVVTALLGAMQQVEATWVAIAMTDGDREALKQAKDGVLPSPLKDQKMQLRYVTVPKNVYRNYYDRVSNQILWFTQHYLLDATSRETPSTENVLRFWDEGYSKANQAIARAVCEEIAHEQSRPVVMLHDYHLYLAPALIREQYPHIVMQHFIHIPWPEIRYWQTALPTRITDAIFSGLLGNDIIGFQTQRDAQNFLEGARTLFSDAEVDIQGGTIMRGEHRTLIRDYPISISVTDERKLVKSNAAKKALKNVQLLLGERTIVRVDRIEPTKNILQGFEAYRLLLEQHPEWHKRVTFLAFLVPSRQGVPAYRRYQEDVNKMIDAINQEYGSEDWTPITAFVQNDRTQALAAMQQYDVLLVNSLFDGMNLVAKEGPTVNQKDGILVLSRTSGAFQQLEQACLPISPTDTIETAEALFTALTMSDEERHELAEKARQEVETHDLQDWIVKQIETINDVSGEH